jgi:hypothetical protein
VFKLMRGYGRWLQLSVFQCRLSAQRRAEMARRLEEVIHGRDDHVLILDLGAADKVDPAYPRKPAEPRGLHFRGFVAAASLKPGTVVHPDVVEAEDHFRGFVAAASLKPRAFYAPDMTSCLAGLRGLEPADVISTIFVAARGAKGLRSHSVRQTKEILPNISRASRK